MPNRLIWGDQDERAFSPSLEMKMAAMILKNNLSETVFSQPGRGKILIIDNFSPGWGQRRVAFLSRAYKTV